MSIHGLFSTRAIAKSLLFCGTAMAVALVITDMNTPAQASGRAARGGVPVEQPDGQTYYVSEDNANVLGVETTAPLDEAIASRCTPEAPCRYDDFEESGGEFVLTPGSWPTTGVTYSFGPGTADIAGNFEAGLGAQAFGLWSNVARVRPVEVVDGGAGSLVGNMRQLWAIGNHGDGFPFDGPSGVLAHCFYPPPVNAGGIAGDCHFDDAENWVTPALGGAGIDVVTVMAHEIGHGLGLAHSADPNALMYPFYSGRRAYLGYDDIAGIVAKYGNRTEDVIFQIEALNTVAPGLGSFRLRENSISVQFHQKGAAAVYQTRLMPSATADFIANGTSDVDGVLANPTNGTQFDSYIWHLGDLYRAQMTLDVARLDVDRVIVTLNITNNVLVAPASVTLKVSMNGRVLGNIVVSPGNVVKTTTFNLTPPFVNPNGGARREGENAYNKATQ